MVCFCIQGLLFGVYTDHGTRTCGSRTPGSYHYEQQDAEAYANWKVDFVKDDDCVVPEGATAEEDYAKMSAAIRATGRPMVFSVKQSEPIELAPKICNMRRVGRDIKDFFYDMIREVDTNHEQGLAKYARPGFWNDMDMMEIGNGLMDEVEERTHMSFWCLLKSPLILGNDLSAMSSATLEILSNREALSLNKDPLGVQGTLRASYSSGDGEALAIMDNCSLAANQVWSMTSQSQLMHHATGSCLEAGPGGHPIANLTLVHITECKSGRAAQQWKVTSDGQFQNGAFSGSCLSIVKPTSPKYQLQLAPCKGKGKGEQEFHFNKTSKQVTSASPLFKNYPLCISVDNVDDLQVWASLLGTDGVQKAWAALLFNRALFFSHKITLSWKDLGVPETTKLALRDLWQHSDLGEFTGNYTATVPSHGGLLLQLSPV